MAVLVVVIALMELSWSWTSSPREKVSSGEWSEVSSLVSSPESIARYMGDLEELSALSFLHLCKINIPFRSIIPIFLKPLVLIKMQGKKPTKINHKFSK